jgi:hypothetical protein
LKNIYNRNTNYVKKSLLRKHFDLTNEKLKIENHNKSVNLTDSSSICESLPITEEDEQLYKSKQEEIMKESFVLKTNFLEPAWKLIVSSKALLPALYERYPNHKNFIPAYFENPYTLRNKMKFKNLYDMHAYKQCNFRYSAGSHLGN